MAATSDITALVERRCRITDDDFMRAELSAEDEAILLERMYEVGYTIGHDVDGRNEWWPPDNRNLPVTPS